MDEEYTLADNAWALVWAIVLYIISTGGGSVALFAALLIVVSVLYDYLRLWADVFGLALPTSGTLARPIIVWLNANPIIAHMISTYIFVEIFAQYSKWKRPH